MEFIYDELGNKIEESTIILETNVLNRKIIYSYTEWGEKNF